MYRRALFAAVVLAVVMMGSAVMAASASELLEKGIYTEETVGNLDEAIAIYEKVIADAKASHALAAQAQYRLGQCLLKKGKKAEATAAFQKLIADFADQKELVAKARKFVPEGIQLEPAPWVDGEVLQLTMRMAGGLEIGTLIYTAQSAELGGRKIWRVGSRTFVWRGYMNGMSRVDADWDTFRPIESRYKNSLLGDISVKFSPTQLIVTAEGPEGKSTKKIDETQVVYDNEQAMDVIRRLPLAPGYKVTLPVLAIGGSKIELPIEVQGKEVVKVPAGEFECFKLHLGLVNQTFWYSADPHRYLVKFDATSAIAELASIGQLKPGELRRFEDEKLGISLMAPDDWFFYEELADGIMFNPSAGTTDKVRIAILDPQATAVCLLTVTKASDLQPEEQKSLRKWVEGRIAEAAKTKQDFKVRPDTWHEAKIAGLPAVSVIADYTEGKREMVGYWTYVRSDSLTLVFAVLVRQEDFDGFRKQFDPIVQSLKVKQP